jgi:hypothetical protein
MPAGHRRGLTELTARTLQSLAQKRRKAADQHERDNTSQERLREVRAIKLPRVRLIRWRWNPAVRHAQRDGEKEEQGNCGHDARAASRADERGLENDAAKEEGEAAVGASGDVDQGRREEEIGQDIHRCDDARGLALLERERAHTRDQIRHHDQAADETRCELVCARRGQKEEPAKDDRDNEKATKKCKVKPHGDGFLLLLIACSISAGWAHATQT